MLVFSSSARSMPGWLGKSGVRTESGNLLSVLDELHTNTLPNGRVGLFGLNSDLLEDYTLGVGGTSERRGFECCSESALLV